MNTDNPRLATLTATVFAQIKDQFQKDDGVDLALVSPINEGKLFDLYSDNPDGSWDININGCHNAEDNLYGHPDLEAAKTRVAEIIAEEIYDAELLIKRAEAAFSISSVFTPFEVGKQQDAASDWGRHDQELAF